MLWLVPDTFLNILGMWLCPLPSKSGPSWTCPRESCADVMLESIISHLVSMDGEHEAQRSEVMSFMLPALECKGQFSA